VGGSVGAGFGEDGAGSTTVSEVLIEGMLVADDRDDGIDETV